MAKRSYGTGSVFQAGNGLWLAQWDLPRGSDGKRRRRQLRATTEAEARERLGSEPIRPSRKPEPVIDRRRGSDWVARHLADHATAKERRTRAADYIERVLLIASAEGWPSRKTAAVLLAQLTPSRVRRGIFGPCAYCGSWLATDVDHVIPKARGGSDDPANLASACKSCNSSKHARTPEEWIA